MMSTEKIKFAMDRDEIIGSPSHYKVSNLGVVQFRNNYDSDLLQQIACKAIAIKDTVAEKRHLGLNYIRAAHLHIPEIQELFALDERLDRLSELAGTRLENYPTSIISSIITFAGVSSVDGTIVWHADGIPVTELVPLIIDDIDGGELELFRGPAEEGLARYDGREVPQEQTIAVTHEVGYSVLGQLMRLMHRVRPIRRGFRVTLNLNLRSTALPFIDDNTPWYLAADNPDLLWMDEYLRDLREKVVPAYLAAQA
jgi:hypothetical protein